MPASGCLPLILRFGVLLDNRDLAWRRPLKRKHKPCGAALVGLLATLITACTSSGSRQQTKLERNLSGARAALEARGDADSLAAAAEITDWPKSNDMQRLALLTRAVSLAPTRVDLLWLQLGACATIETCDPTPLATTLHELDSDNGAPWIALLDRAIKREDADAASKYLNAIASSKRFDIYWNRSITHLATALTKVHMVDTSAALTAMIGTEGALAFPPYQVITKACRAPSLEKPDRIDTCRRIAEVMRNGDTYITEMTGIAITKRVWPEGSVEYSSAVAATRLAHYRIRTEGSIAPAVLSTNAMALEYLQLLTANRTEQEVTLAIIRGAGKNPNPPPYWKEPVPEGS